MPNVARNTLRGSELPKRIADQFGDGAEDDVYLVETRRLSRQEREKLGALRAHLQIGIDQLDAGQWIEGKAMFAELRKELFPDDQT